MNIGLYRARKELEQLDRHPACKSKRINMRHLVLFNLKSLKKLLVECGFIDIELKVRRNIIKNFFPDSSNLQQDLLLSDCKFRFLPVKNLRFIKLTDKAS